MIRKRFVIGLAAVCSVVRLLEAQPPDPARDARAVVEEFIKQTSAERWTDAAALLDLAAFERYLKNRVNMARAALPSPPTTVEELMARDSTMPRAVAEWHVAKSREDQKQYPFGDFSHEYAGVTSFRALQALTPTQAAARWLEAQDPRTAMRKAMAQSNCPSQLPDSALLFKRLELRTIGAAVTDDTTAYVLLTNWFGTESREPMYGRQPHLIELRRTSVGWRIVSPVVGAGGWNFAVGVDCIR